MNDRGVRKQSYRARGVGAAGSVLFPRPAPPRTGSRVRGINRLSGTAGWPIPRVMKNAAEYAARFRIVIDRLDDQTFFARCPEIPGARSRGMSIDSAVDSLRAILEREILALWAKGRNPRPLHDTEGRLGAWTEELELDDNAPEAASKPGLQKPTPAAIHAMAQWTIDRY